MGSRPRFRIYANVSGIDREVLSIIEKKDHSLTLIFAMSDNVILNGNLDNYVHEHFSVHNSNGGMDTTITMTTRIGSGDTWSSSAFLKDTNHRLCWNLRSERTHYVSSFKKFEPHKRDKTFLIGKYNQDLSSFLFSVFIAKSDFIIPNKKDENLNYFEFKFNKYKIILVQCFVNVKSLPLGFTQMLFTSEMVVNRQYNTNRRQIKNSESVPDELFHEICKFNVNESMQEWYKQYKQITKCNDEHLYNLIEANYPSKYAK